MKEFITVAILALIITPIITTLNIFNLPQDPAETTPPKPFNVPHKIITTPGIVGCLSEESLQQITKFYLKKNSAAMQSMVNEGLCVYFENGRELLTREDACPKGKNTEGKNIFVSIPKKMTSEFYLPCSAIF